MCEIHVDGFFLVCPSFLWLVRWVGSGGGGVYDRFHQVSGMIWAIMGWLSFRWERQRASISSLLSMYRSIRGMDASISIVIMGVVLNAPVMSHRHSFCSHLIWLRIRPLRDLQKRGRP